MDASWIPALIVAVTSILTQWIGEGNRTRREAGLQRANLVEGRRKDILAAADPLIWEIVHMEGGTRDLFKTAAQMDIRRKFLTLAVVAGTRGTEEANVVDELFASLGHDKSQKRLPAALLAFVERCIASDGKSA